MADNSALRAEASTTTDQARLAAIVQEDASLGAVVAANPAAYDALLDWLQSYGDDAAKAAVAARRAAPAATATAAPAAPRKPLSPTMKKGLLFGGIGLAALALIVVAVVALTTVLGGGSSASIRTVDIGSEPRDDAWGLISPLVEAGDLDDEDTLHGSVTTVAQDRALVHWTAQDDSGDDTGDFLMSLLDTRTGSLLWTVEWEEEFDVVSAGTTPYVISTYDDDDGTTLYSIDAGNGDVISDSSGLDDPTVMSTTTSLERLGGDLLIASEDGVGRYSPRDFDEEKWFVDVDYDDEYPSVAGNRLIIEDTAYAIDSGTEVDWEADDDVQFFDLGGRIVGQEGDSDDANLALYSENGEEQWSYELDGSSLAFADGDILLVANEDDETLISIDLANGEERWSVDTESGYAIGGSAEAGVAIFPTDDSDEGVAIDLASGEELYSVELEDDGYPISIIGLTARFFYATGNEDGDLVAYDTRTGDEVWTLDNPDEYTFVVVGGQIIGAESLSAEDGADDPSIIGIQP